MKKWYPMEQFYRDSVLAFVDRPSESSYSSSASLSSACLFSACLAFFGRALSLKKTLTLLQHHLQVYLQRMGNAAFTPTKISLEVNYWWIYILQTLQKVLPNLKVLYIGGKSCNAFIQNTPERGDMWHPVTVRFSIPRILTNLLPGSYGHAYRNCIIVRPHIAATSLFLRPVYAHSE